MTNIDDPGTKNEGMFQHPDNGWWEYGVGGYVDGKGKPLEPTFAPSQLLAEISAERTERLYVVKRWVIPSPWEKLTPKDIDDHPTVDNYEWQRYLEWRAKALEREAKRAQAKANGDESYG